MTAKVLPKPGDRVGYVYGPGDFPQWSKGTVLAVYSDRWHDHNAIVLKDDGTICYLHGQYTTVGIGCYLLKEAKEQA